MLIISDFKYACRLLAKKPGFSLLTILVMASGIGLSLFLFSFFHNMLFKDLPFKDGESLVQLNITHKGISQWGGIDLHDYYEVRTSLEGVEEFGAYRESSVNVSGRDGARQYDSVIAEPNIFAMTRTQPIIGRSFTESESQDGAEPVVVIGYDLWQNYLGADPQVLDQMLRINSVSHRIIGVMPKGYTFPRTADLWVPMQEDATRLPRGSAGHFYGVALLEKGVSRNEINKQLALIMQRLEQRYPETNAGISAYVTTFPMTAVRDGVAVVYAMQIAAMLIFCLALINVGNLLLSRAIERSKETAIRVALGAPRWRLVGQMLWESIIICVIGGVIGLLVLAWGLEVVERITLTFFDDKPVFWWDFGVDGFTLKLFFVFIVLAVLATGLLPALRNSGSDFNAALRDGTRGAAGRQSNRLHKLLVISEIFLSTTVLIAAAAMVVGAYLATHADFGVNTDNILTAKVRLPEADYTERTQYTEFVKTLQSRLENSPGIGNVMIASSVPGEWSWVPAMAVEGREYISKGGEDYARANYVSINVDALKKLGVELKAGRYFNSGDDRFDARSVIITESFAARYFPDESPLDKRIRIAEKNHDKQEWLTIVGVVEHTIYGQANDDTGKTPTVFRTFSQLPRNYMTIALQMKADAEQATRTLRSTLASIDPELPAYHLENYNEIIKRSNGPLSLISKIFLLMGVVAIVLAASGIYGVMANTVNQKTQEIGVKRALGATDGLIGRQFLMLGVRQLLWGGVPGALAGYAMGVAMSRIVGLQGLGLVVIAVMMTVLVAAVVLTATWLPTRRALDMEPGEALRYE